MSHRVDCNLPLFTNKSPWRPAPLLQAGVLSLPPLNHICESPGPGPRQVGQDSRYEVHTVRQTLTPSLNPHSPLPKGLCYPSSTRRVEPGPERFCESPRRRPGLARSGPHSFLSTGPPSAPPPSPALRSPHTASQRRPTWPVRSEVSPAVLSQGTIHPSRLLIETMCSAAGQGGGSSGSQAWPGACGCWEDWGRRAS